MVSLSRFFQPLTVAGGVVNKVLIVEDDANYVVAVLRKLKDFFQMESVSTLKEAVEAFGTDTFSAVLMDIGLPDTRIDNTVKLMKGCYPNCAIVVLSGHEDPKRIKQCIADSASSYLIKGRDDQDGAHMATAINCAIHNNAVFQKAESVRKQIENGTEI